MTSSLDRLRPELRKLSAYQVADASGLMKLDAMENPYDWSPELRQAWLQHLAQAQLNRYPQPDPAALKEKLRSRFGPHSDAAIILGNGSDELIQLLALAVAKPGACALNVSPSFSMYSIIAELVGLKNVVVDLDQRFELNIEAMLAAIDEHDPALIFLAYPNNPTGNLWPREDIYRILEASSGLVVIDEAYGPFAADSFTDDLVRYENALLLRTASKLGLAGIRFGWLAAAPALMAELNKIRLPYNINELTQLTMDFALDHYEVFAQQAKQICASRSHMLKILGSLEGVKVYPSEANFVLIRLLHKDATELFQELRDEDAILIKNLSKQAGLTQCLRLTVGTEIENQTLCEAITRRL
ncbi:MAG: histidinol-phosphate transaminase [Gammaproteobacteria bacterium]|nr:histidinol-phosphate transaminase [Gammaproteobacteria bacterium]